MITIMSEIWREIFSDAPERTYDEGARLFHRDDTVAHAFLVRRGSVSLVRALADGRALTLHRAGSGALVAEASLFAERYHCDGVCDAPTLVAVMPRGTVMAALGRDGPAMAALRRASHEVQALRTRMEVMRLKTLRERLDAYIELFGLPPKGAWVTVADWIGVTPEALYRELAKRRR